MHLKITTKKNLKINSITIAVILLFMRKYTVFMSDRVS